MAFSHANGVASDPTDLLNTLVTWLTGLGWTVDSNVADGTGKRAHLHKSGLYVNLRSHVAELIWDSAVQPTPVSTGIGIYLGSGYSGASNWRSQAGGPIMAGGTATVGATMRLTSGSITRYDFYDDGSDNVVVVVERSGGLIAHLGFGPLFTKAGTLTGGAYFFASQPAAHGGTTTACMGDDNNSAPPPMGMTQPYATNSSTDLGCAGFVKADVDAFTSKWIGLSCMGTTGSNGYTGKRGHTGIDLASPATQNPPTNIPGFFDLGRRLVSTFNAQAVLVPIRMYVERDAGSWSLIGRLPTLFLASAVGNGFGIRDPYVVNGKTFTLYPRFAVRSA